VIDSIPDNSLTQGVNRPMRVANIIEEGKLGGPQIRMAMVAKALPENIETTLIIPRSNSKKFLQLCHKLNIRYKTVYLSRITKQLLPALAYISFSLFEILYLAYLFRKEKYDLIHVSGGSWQYKGVIAGYLSNCKVIWHLNDTYKPKIFRLIFSSLAPLADGYIFASERTKEYYQAMIDPSKASFVIPAPVDTVKFDPDIESEAILNEKYTEIKKKIIATVGNVNSVKGLDFLIDIASEARSLLPEHHFIIAGPISVRQEKYYSLLMRKIRALGLKNISFLGPVSDVRSLLKAADVYLCTSKFESSPLSVWEAMAMKCPVVSTNVGDVPLYVKDRVNGFIVSERSPKIFASRIKQILSSPNDFEFFGINSRRIAVKHLDIKICVRKHINAYDFMFVNKIT